MNKILILALSLLTLPTAAHATIKVSLNREVLNLENKAIKQPKSCLTGYVLSLELKSLAGNEASYAKTAIMNIGRFGGLRSQTKTLARVTFDGNDMATGLNLSHLVYRNGGVSVPVTACLNGDLKIGPMQ